MNVNLLKKIKRFFAISITTLIILLLALFLMISYEHYIKIINSNKEVKDNIKFVEKNVSKGDPDITTKIGVESLDHVKVGYKEKANESPHIFVVDVLKIGNCKYILIHSHINNYTDIELVHANDCEKCLENENARHEKSRQLLDIIIKEELEKQKLENQIKESQQKELHEK